VRRLIYILLAGLLAVAAINVGTDDTLARLSAAEHARGLDRAA
jgi:hypothetical protein